MKRPPVGALVHLVVERDGGDGLGLMPYCIGVEVIGHCREPDSEGGEGDCLMLRRLDRGEVLEHVPHDDGSDGPQPSTWHRFTLCQ